MVSFAYRRFDRTRAHRWAAALLLFGALTRGGATGEDVLLESWFKAQTQARTWSADFVQTRSLKALSQPLMATGQVCVALPDRFRWELGRPPQTIALRRPEALWVIYPRLHRAEKYPLNQKQPGPWRDVVALLEAGFPRTRAELESRFHIVSLGCTHSNLALRLQPRDATMRRLLPGLQMELRTNDFSLVSMRMNFADGSEMRNDFSRQTLNPVLPADCFEVPTNPPLTVVEPLKH